MPNKSIREAAHWEMATWQTHHEKNEEGVRKAMIEQFYNMFPCLTREKIAEIVEPRVQAFFVHDKAEDPGSETSWEEVNALLVEHHNLLRSALISKGINFD